MSKGTISVVLAGCLSSVNSKKYADRCIDNEGGQ
jgi:hypothetical protein